MKNVLFLVHGVGRQATDWSRQPLAALEAAMKHYPECLGKPLRDYADVVEIRYDDIFDFILKQWQTLAQSVPPNPGFDCLDDLADLLERAGDDGNVFSHYGGDVLFYCGFRLVARAVRLRINAVIAGKIWRAVHDANRAGAAPPKFAVVAHSLGTAIAQDALHQLSTGGWLAERAGLEQALPGFAAGQGLTEAQAADLGRALEQASGGAPVPVALHALFLVSDTSPLLHQAQTLYSHLPLGGGYDCKAVCVIDHDYDPISLAGKTYVRAAPPPRLDLIRIPVRHFHREWVHDFDHYLEHPSVHAPIFRFMTDDFTLECLDKAQALAREPQWQGVGGELEAKLRAVRSAKKNIAGLRDTLERYAREIKGIVR